MSNIPVTRKKRTNYENFVAECPWCSKDSIFNRATDLCTFEPIAGRDVSCQNVECLKPFRIVGDSVNNPHEMLVFDCYELIDRKHYMNSILNLAQAYEVFFSIFFRVELLYKPFSADRDKGVDELNRLSNVLQDRIKEHAFARMRALFLWYLLAEQSPKNLTESEVVIARFPNRPGDPKDADIESFRDTKLVPLLKALKATSINALRNNIIHRQAYRPTREEVEAALKETRSILFPLTNHLQLYNDVNWYMRER